MKAFIPITFILLFCSFNTSHASSPRLSNMTDLDALLSFKSYITSDPKGILDTWNPNTSFCTWEGVLCNATKQRVTGLALGNLSLTGTISPHITKLSFLHLLDLQNNTFLHGSIPRELGHLFRLETLLLNSNAIQGTIPASLGCCSRLRVMDLSDSRLEGSIPPEIGNLSSQLSQFNMGANYLKGNVPDEIGNLSSLIQLYLESNLFSGRIPSTIGNLKNLQILSLHSNNLSGAIPESLGRLVTIYALDLSNNGLTGNIPSSLSECEYLQSLDLSLNGLDGYIPKEIFNITYFDLLLNISWNSLNGPLPSDIGNLNMVQAIDISNNQLSGTIPRTIGDCSDLKHLNLGGNAFQWRIPDSLSDLTWNKYINLSSNNFSGTVPPILESLPYLELLDLSHNKLHGEVPKEGIFVNSKDVSLTGNPGLCGGTPNLDLPKCATTGKHWKRSKKRLVIGVVIGSTTFCLILGFGFLFVLIFRRGKRDHKQATGDATSKKIVPELYSFYKLKAATNNFNSENMIGEGKFGSVYKGILRDGSTVAIKVFKMDQQGATKSFLAECEALRNVRCRNLVKILSACSTDDFKALVLKFMQNGSLEQWIHNGTGSLGQEKRRLNLQQRVDVAIDVASALEYLHNESGTPMVHSDLKPCNVLLDEEMTAHVADFGLARILHDTSSSHHPASTLGLKGSIGYVAPEYGLGRGVSTKVDVYSYGILLLEMFTGKKPTSELFKDGLTLHKWTQSMLPGQLIEILDAALVEDCKILGEDGVMSIIKIGLS